MKIKAIIEEQITAIQERIKKDSNSLSVEDFVSLHRQLESYISLYLRE